LNHQIESKVETWSLQVWGMDASLIMREGTNKNERALMWFDADDEDGWGWEEMRWNETTWSMWNAMHDCWSEGGDPRLAHSTVSGIFRPPFPLLLLSSISFCDLARFFSTAASWPRLWIPLIKKQMKVKPIPIITAKAIPQHSTWKAMRSTVSVPSFMGPKMYRNALISVKFGISFPLFSLNVLYECTVFHLIGFFDVRGHSVSGTIHNFE